MAQDSAPEDHRKGRQGAVRFHCRGHRHIRGLHHKTFELTRETEITERATCVLGVGADYLPQELARLRGPLNIELIAGEFRETARAETSPLPAVEETLVFRRSEVRAGRTFAYRADRAAKSFDRGLVAALRDPRTLLEVTIRPAEPAGPERRPSSVLLLAALEGAEGSSLEELAPELRRALQASDWLAAPQAALAGRALRRWGLRRRVLPCRRPRDVEELRLRLERGGRLTALVAETDLAAGAAVLSLIAEARELGATVLPVAVAGARRALFAAGLPAIPSLYLGSSPADGLPRRSRGAMPGATLLWSAPSGQAKRELLDILKGSCLRQLAAAWDPGSLEERFLTGSAEEILAALDESDDREVVVLVVPAEEAPANAGQNLPEPALLQALLAAGVPLRTLADALASATGAPRRSQYQALLSLQDKAKEPAP
jgi:16S rRNA C1402 (ribose-2'-O) methylase RsmI